MTVCVAYIILCLCGVSVLGYMQVRINRLHIKDIAHKGTTFEEEYWYVAGDIVDVWCLKSKDYSSLKLTYEFGEENIGGNGNITHTSAYSGYVGILTMLTSAHNGKYISCQCNKYSINVKFVEQESFDELLDLKVNSIISRYQQPTRLRNDDAYYLEYAFMKNQPVSLECQTNVEGAELETYKDNKLINNTLIEDKSEVNLKVKYVMRKDLSTERIINLSLFKNFHDILYDGEFLTINTSGSVLEVYEHKRSRLVYYDYDDGEILVLNCSTLSGVIQRGFALVFNETVEKQKVSTIKQFQLSSGYENKTVNCSLVNTIDNSTVRYIRILFRKRTVTSLEGTRPGVRALLNTTQLLSLAIMFKYTGSEYWLLPVAGLVVCIVMVVISVAVCYVRKRNRIAKGAPGDNSEAQLYENTIPIPSHPPQWDSQYDLPTDREQDEALYSEVQRYGPALYPRVGSSSSEKDAAKDELIYADLDIPSSDQVPKQINCEESPYAEIYHDNSRL